MLPCGGLASQNLLQNPSFETLRSDHPIVRPGNPADFAYQIPGWTIIGGGPVICTDAYRGAAVDTTSFFCADGKLSPFAGHAMMELQYVPQCISPAMTLQGCSDYLAQELAQPMLFGKVYELTIRLYIPATSNPDFARNIGFQAYTETLPAQFNYLLEGREFLLDTVLFDQWYTAKWTIRPECDLPFIVFGVFRDEQGPPTHNRKVVEDFYFLDDLKLIEVGADAGAREAPFCKTQPVIPGPKVLPGLSLYFDPGKAVIRPGDQPLLDSLGVRMRRYPATVFEISGHTDTTGNNHLELSVERIDSVLAYLQRNHGINPLRFVRVPSGDRLARENSGVDDLQIDRRVTVVGSASYPQRVLYRHILEALRDGQRMQTIKWLYTWLVLAPDREILLAEYDPRLGDLLRHPVLRGPFIMRKAKVYTPTDYHHGKPFLDSLWHEDQLTRTLPKYLENIFYYVPALDSTQTYWRVSFPSLSEEEYLRRDVSLAALATRWLERHGWPKTSEVGTKAARAIPLTLIHSDDTTTIATYLPEFYARCRKGEGDWKYYALLFDRYRIATGQPQRYGTQFRRNPVTGKRERLPVEDWAEMNRLRREMGVGEVER